MGGKTQPITGRKVRKSDGIYTTIKYMILEKKHKSILAFIYYGILLWLLIYMIHCQSHKRVFLIAWTKPKSSDF